MIKHLPLDFSNIVAKLLVSSVELSSFVKFNQLSCQCLEKDLYSIENRLSRSTGSLTRQSVQYVDKDFKTLCPEFEFLSNTIQQIDTVLNKKTVRLRIMTMLPKTCLSYHKDFMHSRWHIPLKTNSDSFFVVDESFYRMPKIGNLYTIRTDVKHTAINASYNETRIHLVGSLV
jgi:hypothetical protein